MPKLNAKYTQILWMNTVLLSGGVGFLVWKKFDDNIIYGVGAAFAIGVVEYVVMRYSLARKQRKEEDQNNQV